jgi:hypothetical protein
MRLFETSSAHRLAAFAVLPVVLLSLTAIAQPASNASTVSNEAFQELKQTVSELQAEVAELRLQMRDMRSASKCSTSSESGVHLAEASYNTTDLRSPAEAPHPQTEAPAKTGATTTAAMSLTPEDRGILDYLRGTTTNVSVDGYYSYNFNNPIGRVNLLRAYDVSSNAFALNQAAVIFEHAAENETGHRFGTRLDLQFGQATASLQGNPVNEPRPDIYRNIFQAFGTYIAPVAKGWKIDFGKFASSLGLEGNYTKDQVNYSRSYWFSILPFYHMGIRTNLQLNDKLAINYWIVNGTNQVEPTNGYKDELFGFVLTPNKQLSWTVNYYLGNEHPNAVATSNCGPVPVQPGLCFEPVIPAPDGKLHIFDSYVTWQATPKLSFGVEGDYEIQRLWSNAAPGQSSAPSHVTGGEAYVQYQFNPKYALAARTEYVSDRGGLFSGVTEALKEVTATYTYNVVDGFQLRTEWRRDWSNVPIFLTDTPGKFSQHQNTATLGLVWWFGRKQGAW